MKQWIKQEWKSIQTSPLRRTLIQANKNVPETTIGGEQKILAASNNYLGLATDERVVVKAKEALDRFGTGSGGSRLTTGNLAIHEQLERELAYFKRTEACLLYSSGFLANLGVITALSDEETISFIDACRLTKAKVVIYGHTDMQDLEKKLTAYRTHAKKIIVTDGVFSMDGDLAPLEMINFLKEKHEALLIVDDAHGTGVIGEKGRGTVDYF